MTTRLYQMIIVGNYNLHYYVNELQYIRTDEHITYPHTHTPVQCLRPLLV